jgi:hypothetical protein
MNELKEREVYLQNRILDINTNGSYEDIVHCGECKYNNVYACKHPQGLKYCATPDCSCKYGERMDGI